MNLMNEMWGQKDFSIKIQVFFSFGVRFYINDEDKDELH